MTYRFLIPVLAVAILAIPLTAQDVEDRYWFRFPPGLFEHDPLLFDDTLELHDIETRGENLYVAGQITHVNGAFVGSLALYNGYDRSWHDLDSGVGYAPMLNPRASDIAVTADGTLYVGDGHYAEAGGPRTPSDPGGTLIGTEQMARFLGGVWSAISKPEARYDMVVADDGRLYALGFNLMRWNGAAWELIAAGINHAYSAHTQNTWPAVATGGGRIYFRTRLFDTLGRSAVHIRRWDLATGTMSTLPGRGLSGAGEFKMQALAVGTEGEIYVGGLFTTAGERTVRNIARYNPTDSSWSTLGQGLDGEVRALAIGPSGELYAGGAFTMAGDQPVNHIAMWNGSRWIGLGTGVDGPVHDLAFDALGRLYVIGTFLQAGGGASHYLARWDKEGEVTRPPLVVNTLEDKGDGSCDSVHCSLRDAIEEANRNRNRDTIYFDLKQKGRRVYMPDSALPYLTQPVLIDGRRDSGVQVVIDGSKIPGGSPGIVLSGGKSVLRGVSIVRFPGDGVRIVEKDGNAVEACFIGTDADTTDGLGNGWNGIYISASSDNRVGYDAGITLYDSLNVITDNGYSGVFIESGERNSLNGNIIFHNGALGIDLAPIGVNANDSADLDSGPNTLLNAPHIDSGLASGGLLTIFGHVDGKRGTVYLIEIFVSDSADATGFGEGKYRVWTTVATANDTGLATFSTSINALKGNEVITATAGDTEGNTSEFSAAAPHRIRLLDTKKRPISDRRIAVWKVRTVNTTLQYDLIDSIDSDDKGVIEQYGLATGDTFRVGLRLDTKPSMKHTRFPTNAMMIDLDNGVLDSLTFLMRYDTIDVLMRQDVTLGHTELLINLLVSIEWDAQPGYIAEMEESFRLMSNFLYDVFDGQARFDTIVVERDARRWGEADIRIKASNVTWPVTAYQGLTDHDTPLFEATGWVEMPRRWYGDNTDLEVTIGRFEYPYQLTNPTHFSTIAHEFGHYGFNFGDEYGLPGEPVSPYGSPCVTLDNIGFMCDQYVAFTGNVGGSEMSWSRRNCAVTQQMKFNGMSCWDHVDSLYQGEYDSIHAPILTPDERFRPVGVDYVLGPNDRGGADIDVGELIRFPNRPAATTASDLLFIARKPDGTFTTSASVSHLTQSNGSFRFIDQGRNTAHSGIARVMGARAGDLIWVHGHGPLEQFFGKRVGTARRSRAWWFGAAVVGESGTSDLGTDFLSENGQLTVTMRSVEATPFVLLSEWVDGAPSIRLDGSESTLSEPAITIYGKDGSTRLLVAAKEGDDHVIDPGDLTEREWNGLISSGAGSEPLLLPFSLAHRRLVDAGTLVSADGFAHASVTLANGSAGAGLIASTPFPVPLDGIDSTLMPIGSSYSIALSEGAALSAPMRIEIRYNELDLVLGPETRLAVESLLLFRWDVERSAWSEVESVLDTANNIVAATSPVTGTFILAAGFTKPNYPTDGRSVELGLLHPNPFVDRAEIPLLLDKPAHVTVTVHDLLGRELTVIADREFFAGESTLEWDGTNNEGGRLPGGVYFIVAKVDGEHAATQGISIQVE